MDINIGNDIRIDFLLRNIDTTDQLNIKQLRCYLVNTSDNYNDYSEHCVHRFPNEPFPQYYNPTTCTIRGCGSFDYNVLPQYNGFGLKPKKLEIRDVVNRMYDKRNIYHAYCTFGQGDLECVAYFPGHDQKALGNYKMLVIVSIYEEGWGEHNIHEFCLEYDDLFTLVKTGGLNGTVNIDLTTPQVNPSVANVELYGTVDNTKYTEIKAYKGSTFDVKFDSCRVEFDDESAITNDYTLKVMHDDTVLYSSNITSDVQFTTPYVESFDKIAENKVVTFKIVVYNQKGQEVSSKTVDFTVECKSLSFTATTTPSDISVNKGTDVNTNITGITLNYDDTYLSKGLKVNVLGGTLSYYYGILKKDISVQVPVVVSNIQSDKDIQLNVGVYNGTTQVYSTTAVCHIKAQQVDKLYIGYVADTDSSTWDLSEFTEYNRVIGDFESAATIGGTYLAFVSTNKITKITISGMFKVELDEADPVDGMYASYYDEPQGVGELIYTI